jgi:hypothetical protein
MFTKRVYWLVVADQAFEHILLHYVELHVSRVPYVFREKKHVGEPHLYFHRSNHLY